MLKLWANEGNVFLSNRFLPVFGSFDMTGPIPFKQHIASIISLIPSGGHERAFSSVRSLLLILHNAPSTVSVLSILVVFQFFWSLKIEII